MRSSSPLADRVLSEAPGSAMLRQIRCLAARKIRTSTGAIQPFARPSHMTRPNLLVPGICPSWRRDLRICLRGHAPPAHSQHHRRHHSAAAPTQVAAPAAFASDAPSPAERTAAVIEKATGTSNIAPALSITIPQCAGGDAKARSSPPRCRAGPTLGGSAALGPPGGQRGPDQWNGASCSETGFCG